MVGQFGLTGVAVEKKKVFTTRVVNHTPKLRKMQRNTELPEHKRELQTLDG